MTLTGTGAIINTTYFRKQVFKYCGQQEEAIKIITQLNYSIWCFCNFFSLEMSVSVEIMRKIFK